MRTHIRMMLVVLICFGLATAAESRDLKASLPELPSTDTGTGNAVFLELVKMIDEVYTEGSISVRIYPFVRSVKNVENGNADFHLPFINNPLVYQDKLLYRPVSEPMGQTDFVIYSHVDNPVSRDRIDAAKKLSSFPYVLETDRGHTGLFDFPIQGQSSIGQMLKKLQAKRIDGFIYVQEETDRVLREMRLKEVHREYYQTYDDIPIVRKDANGDEVDQILSAALKTLKNTGKLQELWKRIHVPYHNLQPSEMGW